jgi:hypothetical protein
MSFHATSSPGGTPKNAPARVAHHSRAVRVASPPQPRAACLSCCVAGAARRLALHAAAGGHFPACLLHRRVTSQSLRARRGREAPRRAMSGSVDHGCERRGLGGGAARCRRRLGLTVRGRLTRCRRRHPRRREPCPDRILDDVGGAFGMGAVGGGIWHFSKGMYNSPRGLSSRLAGGVSVRASGSRAAAARRLAAVSAPPRLARRAMRAHGAPALRTTTSTADALLPTRAPPALRRRCASRRRGWAAASRCGAVSSPRLTARWWLCAKRRGAAPPQPLRAAARLPRRRATRSPPSARAQEDPWNAITSGALTGGFLQARLLRARTHARTHAHARTRFSPHTVRAAHARAPPRRSCATAWRRPAAPPRLAGCSLQALRALAS